MRGGTAALTAEERVHPAGSLDNLDLSAGALRGLNCPTVRQFETV